MFLLEKLNVLVPSTVYRSFINKGSFFPQDSCLIRKHEFEYNKGTFDLIYSTSNGALFE